MTRGMSANSIKSIAMVVLAVALAFSLGMTFTARGSEHGATYFACLYAGSLSQVGTTEPANCGRGQAITWTSADEVQTSSIIDWHEASFNIEAGGETAEWNNYTVWCDDDEMAVAGGFQPGNRNVEVMSSFPTNNEQGWIIRARNTHGETTHELTVFVSCVTQPADEDI